MQIEALVAVSMLVACGDNLHPGAEQLAGETGGITFGEVGGCGVFIDRTIDVLCDDGSHTH